jgi:23S rRNA G2445 N2-methylase RlmL
VTRRDKIRNLDELLRDPGFTPSWRDVGALLTRVEHAEDAAPVERALARLGADLAAPLVAWLSEAGPAGRARGVRLLSTVAPQDPAARARIVRALEDEDARVRRYAALALGRIGAIEAREAVAAAYARAERPEEKRALAEALGKLGGEDAERLLAATRPADAETARVVERAKLVLQRDAARAQPSSIDGTLAPEAPLTLVLRCRAGLEELVIEELGPSAEPRRVAPGRVRAKLAGPLDSAFASRVALSFAIALPRVKKTRDRPADVASALASDLSRRTLARFTRGPIRFRLSFAGGGHQRALVWSCARAIAERAPELVNDPRESVWEAQVREDGDGVFVELVPRALEDPRFSYRAADVPAASHPTIAAALARVAGVREDDVVWDPFVGSGLELVERGRLGPYARMIGTDLDARALDAARRNVASAQLHDVVLREGDALAERPSGVTLVLTNPPMGRRVKTGAGLAPLLDRFLTHAARLLAPGGRLVWLSPQPSRTRSRAREAGLIVERTSSVDMGGFSTELQRLSKPAGS